MAEYQAMTGGSASGGGANEGSVLREIPIRRHFTRAGEDVYASVEWALRTAKISAENGDAVFEQPDVEVPESWSAIATNIVASKYFRGHLGSPTRESSVKQLIGRVVETLRKWGRSGGYFADAEQEQTCVDELT